MPHGSAAQPERPFLPGGEQGFPGPVTRIVVRPIASPLTLGVPRPGGGHLTVAGLELRWVAAGQANYAGLAVLALVFPLQAVSSVFGFLARDIIAGTGTGLLAGGWLVIGLLTR